MRDRRTRARRGGRTRSPVRGSAGALALAVVLAGCGDASLAEPNGLGIEASQYLNYALDVMQFNSVHRYDIDWREFRFETVQSAGEAKTMADVYPVIRTALEQLGDNHSFFQEPESAGTSGPAPQEAPTAEVVAGDVGYLDVPAFTGGSVAGDSIASLYHDLIESVDTTDVCGWVVDLRGNTGGNMWPMIAGLGPVLGEGEAGFFVDPDSVVNDWVYVDGVARIDQTATAVVDPFYRPRVALPPVAVLTDGETASSGEAVAIAFRGRPDARSFGATTYGLSTANAPFGMPDGAVIFLAVAWMGDRTGTAYDGNALVPDESVSGSKTGERSTDAPLDAALTWLEGAYCSAD